MPAVVHPLLQQAFAALDLAGIAWCLLRGEDELERPPGDVDLLISPDGEARMRAALEPLGFAPLPALGREPHLFFLSYHRPTDEWLTVDAVTELSYGPYCSLATDAEEGCLRRRSRQGVVSVLAPDDAFWTLFLHCLLDKRRFEPHRGARLQELAGGVSADGPMATVVASFVPLGWSPERILELTRHGDWSRLKELAPSVARRWAWAQPGPMARRVTTRRLLRMGEKAIVGLHRRGLSVALLGPDGTGKSTLARHVKESFYFPATSVYMGLWQADDKPGRSRLRSCLRVLVRPATIWRRYLFGRVQQLLGRLVIFDRYTYDAYLPPRPPLVRAKMLYFWLLAHSAPAPDLVLLLDAPGDLIAARKQEDTPEELGWQRQHFLELHRRIPGLQIIDATRPLAEVKAEIVDCIWRRYLRRWRRAG